MAREKGELEVSLIKRLAALELQLVATYTGVKDSKPFRSGRNLP